MSRPRDQDGGWAWVVLGACAVCLMVTSGLAILAGIFQNAFLEELDGELIMTSWVTSLFSSLMQLTGPVSGVVCSVFSCRTSVMAGAVLLTTGLLVSSFCRDITALLFTFGISCGVGQGLIFSAAIVQVNLSFVKYRPLATGIVMGAGGMGIMVMPPLCSFLLSSFYCWHTLTIMAAISAQLLVAGALLFHDGPGGKSSQGSHGGVGERCGRRRLSLCWCCVCGICPSPSSTHEKQTPNGTADKSCKTSLAIRDLNHYKDPETEVTDLENHCTDTELALASKLDKGIDKDMKSLMILKQENIRDMKMTSLVNSNQENIKNMEVTSPMIPKQGNVKDREVASLMNSKQEDMTDMEITYPMISKQNCENIKQNTKPDNQPASKTFWQNFVTVLTSPSIVIICFQLFLSSAAVGIVFVHFVAFCVRMGARLDDVSLGFSVNGMTLTVSRFLIGALSQDRNIDPLSVYVGIAFVTSLILVLTPVLAVTASLQICTLAVLGVYCGSSYVLLTEITIHCTGVDTLSLAFGMEMISAGLGTLVAPPVAGWLVLLTNSYNSAIFLAGILYLISAFVIMLLSITRPRWLPGGPSAQDKLVTPPDHRQ